MKKEYIQLKIKAVSIKASRMLCISPVTLNYRGNDNYTSDEGIDAE